MKIVQLAVIDEPLGGRVYVHPPDIHIFSTRFPIDVTLDPFPNFRARDIARDVQKLYGKCYVAMQRRLR